MKHLRISQSLIFWQTEEWFNADQHVREVLSCQTLSLHCSSLKRFSHHHDFFCHCYLKMECLFALLLLLSKCQNIHLMISMSEQMFNGVESFHNQFALSIMNPTNGWCILFLDTATWFSDSWEDLVKRWEEVWKHLKNSKAITME